jgi:hypothetical protein
VWYAADHRCTALTLLDEEHISNPEVWKTRPGRVVAARHGRVELCAILQLSADEPLAEAEAPLSSVWRILVSDQ